MRPTSPLHARAYVFGAFCLVALAFLTALAAPGQHSSEAAPGRSQPMAAVQPAPGTPAPAPAFDEQLWAEMGHEAWYVQNGYMNAPPPAAPPKVLIGTVTPASYLPYAARMATVTPASYLPFTARDYVPPTATPTPTATELPPTATDTPAPTPTSTDVPPTPTATATNPPQNVEARAIWITRFDWTCIQPWCPGGQLPNAETVRQMVANVDAGGFNMILFQIRGNGDAFYVPGLEPWSARLTGTNAATLGQNPGYDPLGVLLAEAHARGIQVHAYFNTYPTWLGTEAPPDNTTPLHPIYRWGQIPPVPPNDWKYWRVWNTSHQWQLMNSSYLWASPGNDWVVANSLVATAQDILSRYQVDGLHLDLVRYPGADYSCDPRSEERWGGSCPGWIPGTSYGEQQKAWITELVGRMYNEAAIPQNRHVALSAAVWWYPRNDYGLVCGPGSDYYQDSYRWLGNGGDAVIDYEMPMMYGCSAFASDASWNAVMQGWLNNRAGRQVFPGIHGDEISWGQIVNRINAERAYAASTGAVPGHSLFSYGSVNSHGYWDDFASGPYAQPAVPPVPGWHP